MGSMAGKETTKPKKTKKKPKKPKKRKEQKPNGRFFPFFEDVADWRAFHRFGVLMLPPHTPSL